MSRSLRFGLAAGGLFVLALCLTGLIYLLITYPVLTRPSRVSTVVSWPQLPAPTVVNTAWRSYTAPQTIRATALYDGLLWAATDGGVVAWEWQTGQAVKFTSEHGLAENVTTAVAVGPDGALWFGTESGGISRFDGITWQTFTTADGLPADHIHDLAVTADGYLWAATANGIGQYDGRRWYGYTRTRSFFQLPGATVNALAVAPDGLTVWAATDEGAARFNGRRWESFTHIGSQAINDVRDIAVTPDGMVWAATPAGLKRHDGAAWQLFTTADGLAREDVRHVTAVVDNTVWVSYADLAAGLTLFDTTSSIPTASTFAPTNQVLQVMAALPAGPLLHVPGGLFYVDNNGSEHTFTLPTDLPGQQLTGLAAAQGSTWVTGAHGVSRFDGTTWQTFTKTHGLPGTAVAALTLDRSGQPVIAFPGAYQGIATFNPAANTWQTTACPVAGPPSTAVRTGIQTAEGTLWFATGQGIARYDGQTWHIFTAAHGLPSDNVQTLAVDNEGTVWAGTDRGLAFYSAGRWQPMTAVDTRALSAGPGGELWYFTDSGLFHMDAGSKVITPLPTPPVTWVYDQLATTDGFWISTDNGIHHWPGVRPSASTTWQSFTGTDGLVTPRITALAQTADGTLWAAGSTENTTASSSLYGSYEVQSTYLHQFDGRHWLPRPLPLAYGLLHPVITDIEMAPDGAVWLATLGGISQFDGDTWQAYAPADGLPTAEVYDLAVSAQGVWAVTKGGLARFEGDASSPPWQHAANVEWSVWENVHLAAAPDGTVWAGGGATLARFDGRQWQAVVTTPPQTDMQIRALAFDHDGQLWLAGYAPSQPPAERHFLAQPTIHGWAWQPLAPVNQFTAINLMRFAPDGRLWLGNDAGLWTVDVPGGNLSQPVRAAHTRAPTDLLFQADGTPLATQPYVTAITNPHTGGATAIPLIDATHTYALAAAPDGSLWVGTDRGAARLSPAGAWDLYPVPHITDDQTISRLAAGGGRQATGGRSLLVGTLGGRVLRFADGLTTAEKAVPTGSERSPVSAIIPAAADDLWAAHFGGGVTRQLGGVWQRFPLNTNLNNAHINSLAWLNNSAWAGTDIGLLVVTTDDGRVHCEFDTVGPPSHWQAMVADVNNQVWGVNGNTFWRRDGELWGRQGALALPVTAVAPDGAVWVVTQNGLARYTHGRRQNVNGEALLGEVTALAIAPDASLWVGTTVGVFWFDGREWQHITAADGLAANHVTHITAASDGSVWAGTAGGISHYRPIP